MIFRRVLLLMYLSCIAGTGLQAQDNNAQVNFLKGIVRDDSLGHALAFVHLWNESRRMGSTSDNSGVFKIPAEPQDTLVVTSIGYDSQVIRLKATDFDTLEIRLKPAAYRINELVVRRFKSYESFLYQVVHLELPESEIAELEEHLQLTAKEVAIEADAERAVREKVETGRFGVITPLGPGINPAKVFADKMNEQKRRQEIIHAKFNRELVSDVTKLKGDDLTDFIAMCNFSEEFLYEATLPEILDSLYARLDTFHKMK